MATASAPRGPCARPITWARATARSPADMMFEPSDEFSSWRKVRRGSFNPARRPLSATARELDDLRRAMNLMRGRFKTVFAR